MSDRAAPPRNGPLRVAVVVFTRDLRVRDHPALCAAIAANHAVVPLFVVDDAVLATWHGRANRLAFLLASVEDLDRSLRERGGALVVRRHRVWHEAVLGVAAEVGATEIHVSDDVSLTAAGRRRRLDAGARAARIDVQWHAGVTVVPPGAIAPAGGGEFKVFTPYHRRWLEAEWRPVLAPPSAVPLAEGVRVDAVPRLGDLTAEAPAASLPAGGERAGLERLRAWAATGLAEYADRHDDLAGAATSQISPYLHLGCLSPLEVAARLRQRSGGDAFVRQLCWRDFYHQVLAARPDAATADYRDRGDRWNDDADGYEAWCAGTTGYPVVDAGMRQLRAEGFMHNRARMIVASFLTKDLYVDWRAGAGHFMAHLADGDLACNQLNWQWTAGTGTDTNPHRIFNPTVQGKRFDPSGEYVRRYVPELASLGATIHDPDEHIRAKVGYPRPLVDHHEAIAEYRARRR